MRHRRMNVWLLSVVFPAVVVLILTPTAPVGAACGDRCIDPPAGLTAWWPAEGRRSTSLASRTAPSSATRFATGEVGDAFIRRLGRLSSRWTMRTRVLWRRGLHRRVLGEVDDDGHPARIWSGGPIRKASQGWDIRLDLGRIQVVGVNSWAINFTSAAVIEVDQWHHVAVTGTDVEVRCSSTVCSGARVPTSPSAPRPTLPFRFHHQLQRIGAPADSSTRSSSSTARFLRRGPGAARIGAGRQLPSLRYVADGAVAWWRAEDNFDEDRRHQRHAGQRGALR